MTAGRIRAWAYDFIEYLESRILKKYDEIAKIISKNNTESKKKNIREKLSFIKTALAARVGLRPARLTLNFIVTSKAEIRVFEPILRLISVTPDIHVYILYLEPVRFSRKFQDTIDKSSNIEVAFTAYSIINSCQYRHGWINVICLDHKKHSIHHHKGIEIVEAINLKGGKTVCLQHGSTRRDNIEGHKTSASKFQVVWGTHIYNALLDEPSGCNKYVFLTGNPLHDRFFRIEKDSVLARLRNYLKESNCELCDRKIILVATCLHSEYDNRQNSAFLYRQYIRKIYESVDLEKHLLIVLMHPVDSDSPNIYKEQMEQSWKGSIKILEAGNPKFSFYDLAKISSLTITRASTVAEETLIIGGKALAFDLFEDGPSAKLDFLQGVPGFTLVAGTHIDLKREISCLLRTTPNPPVDTEAFIEAITYKFDGKSTRRVLEVLGQIAHG